MTDRMRPDRKTNYPKAHDGADLSQDKQRDEEEIRHHPEIHGEPHPAHHAQNKPDGLPLHHPHTHPEGEALNTDHGTHENRPRPGKIAKKADHPGHK